MALPLFGFTDALLQQLQTQWSSALNPVIDLFNRFNTQPPQVTYLTSGSGIYKVPDSTFYLEIEMVGGGGGGAGSGSGAGTAATSGTASTFGPILTAGGGIAGVIDSAGGAGGIAKTTGVVGLTINGSYGSPAGRSVASALVPGGNGGCSFFGGSGSGAAAAGAATDAVANSGSGGGGGYANGAGQEAGAGGGSGAYVYCLLRDNIQSTYGYVVGVGGNAGAAGASGVVGSKGGSGLIVVRAYFQ